MKNIILKVKNVSYTVSNAKSTTNKSIEILKEISFDVERKQIIGISGESGSGKSTLAKVISGITSHTSGKIETFFNNDWNLSGTKPIQLLFQNDGNLINPYRNVLNILTEAFELKNNRRDNYQEKVESLFEIFNLNKTLLHRKGYQLSGGEQQRISLARLMIMEPEILILDEPFSSQDVEAQLNILDLLKKLKHEFDITIICISHDLKLLSNFTDKILIMFKGKIVEEGNTSAILTNPQHDYTRFLLKAQTLTLSKEEIYSFHTHYEQN